MHIYMESPVGAKTVFNGREMDYFGGTGYLGLQCHPAVVQAAQEALQRYGFSTATSRGGFGEHPVYDELEREACAYLDRKSVV
jgi:7-keto-8-aminopelargonate synthetase-like enzyme